MTTEQRNIAGIVGWSILSFIFGVIMIIPMVLREVYQYYKYLKPCNLEFEWMDAVTYGMFIAICGLFHWCVLDICLDSMPWWLAI